MATQENLLPTGATTPQGQTPDFLTDEEMRALLMEDVGLGPDTPTSQPVQTQAQAQPTPQVSDDKDFLTDEEMRSLLMADQQQAAKPEEGSGIGQTLYDAGEQVARYTAYPLMRGIGEVLGLARNVRNAITPEHYKEAQNMWGGMIAAGVKQLAGSPQEEVEQAFDKPPDPIGFFIDTTKGKPFQPQNFLEGVVDKAATSVIMGAATGQALGLGYDAGSMIVPALIGGTTSQTLKSAGFGETAQAAGQIIPELGYGIAKRGLYKGFESISEDYYNKLNKELAKHEAAIPAGGATKVLNELEELGRAAPVQWQTGESSNFFEQINQARKAVVNFSGIDKADAKLGDAADTMSRIAKGEEISGWLSKTQSSISSAMKHAENAIINSSKSKFLGRGEKEVAKLLREANRIGSSAKNITAIDGLSDLLLEAQSFTDEAFKGAREGFVPIKNLIKAKRGFNDLFSKSSSEGLKEAVTSGIEKTMEDSTVRMTKGAATAMKDLAIGAAAQKELPEIAKYLTIADEFFSASKNVESVFKGLGTKSQILSRMGIYGVPYLAFGPAGATAALVGDFARVVYKSAMPKGALNMIKNNPILKKHYADAGSAMIKNDVPSFLRSTIDLMTAGGDKLQKYFKKKKK